MIVSTHAVRRLKHHNLVPKSMDGHRARDFVKKCINSHTINVYQNKKTGARIHITDKFTAVMYGNRVITVYPNKQDLPDKITSGKCEVAASGELSED